MQEQQQMQAQFEQQLTALKAESYDAIQRANRLTDALAREKAVVQQQFQQLQEFVIELAEAKGVDLGATETPLQDLKSVLLGITNDADIEPGDLPESE